MALTLAQRVRRERERRQRAAGRRALRTRAPGEPRSVIQRHHSVVDGVSRAVAKVIRAETNRVVADIRSRQAGERADAAADPDELERTFRALRRRIERMVSAGELNPEVGQVGMRLALFNAAEMRRTFGVPFTALTPAVRRSLARWRRENVDLIRTMAFDQLDDVDRVIGEGIAGGVRHETLARDIARRFEVSRSRAALIARDQVLTANSRVTQINHRRAGVTRYQWATSRDERVRDDHAALDGQTFAWASDGAPDAGTDGGSAHPGEPINCRCVAVPVIE